MDNNEKRFFEKTIPLEDTPAGETLHYEYLKQNRPSTVCVMRLNGTLEEYISDVNNSFFIVSNSFFCLFYFCVLFDLVQNRGTMTGSPYSWKWPTHIGSQL